MSIAPPRPLGPQLFLKPPNAVLHHLCYLNLATLPPRDRICGHTYSISEVLLRQPERRPQRHDVIACHRLDYTQRIPVRCIRSGLGTLRCPRMPGRSPLLLIPRPSSSVRFQEWLSCSAWMGIRASIILSADFGLQRLGIVLRSRCHPASFGLPARSLAGRRTCTRSNEDAVPFPPWRAPDVEVARHRP